MIRKILFTGLLVCSLFALGCDSPGVVVKGSVNLNGQPLSDGDIIFEAADGQAAPTGGLIKDGRYELRMAPGSKIVRINASKPGPTVDPVMGAAPPMSIIPEEYNVKTKLTATVTQGDTKDIDFDLKAKP
jgi:hypothetical protein